LLAILIARYHLARRPRALATGGGHGHLLLTHGVAFLALAAIYINKVRSLLSASLVAVIVFLRPGADRRWRAVPDRAPPDLRPGGRG
jgi:hypothetical protein